MMVTKDESEEGLDIGNEKVLGLRKKLYAIHYYISMYMYVF